jgi:hypothetical protein
LGELFLARLAEEDVVRHGHFPVISTFILPPRQQKHRNHPDLIAADHSIDPAFVRNSRPSNFATQQRST